MFNKSIHISTLKTSLCLVLFLAAFFLSLWPGPADSTCALLLGGFHADCIIVAANNTSIKPRAMMSLHSGDKIIQKSGVNEIVIKCSPFTSVNKLNETTLQIIYQPPSEKKAVLKELQTFLGFEKDNHQSRTAGTRTILGEGSDVFFPQPGYWATVIPGEPIKFSWDRQGIKTIVFRDSSGVEVFSKAFGGKSSIELTPQDIKMKPSEIYYWEIEIQGVPRSSETYSLKLLENDMVELVTSDMKKLADEKLGDTEKKLRTAAYCQFISDTYPKDVDLYWKSYQILKELDKTGLIAEENDLDQVLRDRYIQHIQEQMATGYK
jgi:hypothetical protein